MSTTYTLYKIDRGESFDLGKRIWGLFFDLIPSPQKPFIFPQCVRRTQAYDWIKEETSSVVWEFESEKERILFCSAIANKIDDWCGYDRILMLKDEDQEDDLKRYGELYGFSFRDWRAYKETGSVYTES